MATIYKRTRKRPIPEGAEIITRKGERFAVWTEGKAHRRRRAPLTPDGMFVVIESPGYEIQYFDHNGQRRKKSIRCNDRDAAQQLANDLEKRAMQRREGCIDPTQERFAQESRRSLTDHLKDFGDFLTAKQNTPKHVRTTCRHVRWVLDKCDAESVVDLKGPAVLGSIGDLRESGASLRTCNSHLTSIKSFSRWLWKHKRLADDPLCALEGFNQETDPRHVRREMSPEETARLLVSTENRTRPEHNLSGPDRAMVYRLALGTGFRAKELRSLTPASFDLDATPPTVSVTAACSKRGRTDCQPIRQDLADLLRDWLDGRPTGEPLFASLPGNTARMLRSDLAAARKGWIKEATTPEETATREKSDFLKYENAAGEVADFHATRHTYISNIVAGGASVKTAQELARHSTPTLTIGRYAHTRLHDLQGALDALPSLSPAAPEAKSEHQVLRATGTDDDRIETANNVPTRELWGQILGQFSGETSRNPASDGELRSMPSNEVDKAQVLAATRNENRQQALATAGEKRRRWESNPRSRICNPLP